MAIRNVLAILLLAGCVWPGSPQSAGAQESQDKLQTQERHAQQASQQKQPDRENQIKICKKKHIGVRAPDIKTPQDAANALRKKVNFAPWWIYRNTLTAIFTPLKHAGFRGWTDYCAEACAVGRVLSGVGGIDGMYTVDLALQSFFVNGTETQLDGPRFVRVEFFSYAKKNVPRLPGKGDSVRICGKLMWDGDGFLEIHPRTAADVQFTCPAPETPIKTVASPPAR